MKVLVTLILRQRFKRFSFTPLPPLASSSSSSGPLVLRELSLNPSPVISAMAASPKPREATPPPVIGKAGRYTVFITPPPTPRPSSISPEPAKPPKPSPRLIPSPRPVNVSAFPVKDPPSPPPPVQVPPQQFDKPASRKGSTSTFGFFWDAISKVQNAHSSLDEYLADWFGLNQSKYQWALNDYYESKGLDKDDSKQKEIATKGRAV